MLGRILNLPDRVWFAGARQHARLLVKVSFESEEKSFVAIGVPAPHVERVPYLGQRQNPISIDMTLDEVESDPHLSAGENDPIITEPPIAPWLIETDDRVSLQRVVQLTWRSEPDLVVLKYPFDDLIIIAAILEKGAQLGGVDFVLLRRRFTGAVHSAPP
jgi:hypothetical protein